MKILKAAFGTLGLALVASMASACVEDDGRLYIGYAVPPNDECAFSCSETAFISQGTLDLAIRRSYVGGFLVFNQLKEQGDALNARAETSGIQLQGAEIRVEDTNGSELTAYTVTTAALVPEAAGNNPGCLPIPLTVIPASVTRDLITGTNAVTVANSRTLISRIKLFGETLGETGIESAEFAFPITLCVGCLATFVDYDENCTVRTAQGMDEAGCELGIGQNQSTGCIFCYRESENDPPCVTPVP